MELSKIISALRLQLHDLGYRTDQVILGEIKRSVDGYYDATLYDTDTDEEICIEIEIPEKR